MAARPTVGALTVPYVVDERLSPIDFKQMHPGHVRKCAEQRLCGICGKRIVGSPIAFVGPDDDRRCFADPWMHLDCARLAMQQCPFLGARRGWRGGQTEAERSLTGVYEHNMVLFTAPQGRSHRDDFGHWHFEALGVLRKLAP